MLFWQQGGNLCSWWRTRPAEKLTPPTDRLGERRGGKQGSDELLLSEKSDLLPTVKLTLEGSLKTRARFVEAGVKSVHSLFEDLSHFNYNLSEIIPNKRWRAFLVQSKQSHFRGFSTRIMTKPNSSVHCSNLSPFMQINVLQSASQIADQLITRLKLKN